MRCICVPADFLLNFNEVYTFLYVPCNPLAQIANSYTFLYAPYTFRIRSSMFFEHVVQMLYIPTRSVQPSRSKRDFPEHLHPTTRLTYKAPASRSPCLLRSYTFRIRSSMFRGNPELLHSNVHFNSPPVPAWRALCTNLARV